MNILLCGFMGSGKTTIGKEIATVSDLNFIDTDEMIVNKVNMPITQIFDEYGEQYFRDIEHEVFCDIAKLNNKVISSGGGALMQDRNVKVINDNTYIVFLDIPFNEICERIGNNDSRPLFRDIESAHKLFNERHGQYKKISDIIIEQALTPRETALEILRTCREKGKK